MHALRESAATAAVSAPLYAQLLELSPDEHYVWGVTSAAFVTAGLLLLIAKPPKLSVADLTPLPRALSNRVGEG